jgi:NAD(P)-dependent dehydrogenase (short-subunit alcohol dehydrogenase family)
LGSLTGRVAVVTGASRSMGKGIALALGAEGATVYVTGRTLTSGQHPLPGTVGETAAEVDRRGGKGIAVKVDHANDAEVDALFEQVRREKMAGMASQLNSVVGSSVEFPGRVIAALARDSGVLKRSGGTFITAELAQEYDITDIDGRVIPSLRAQRGAPIWMPV